MVSPGNYVVYRDSPTGGTYHAVRVADGVEIATNAASVGPVLQQVLDQNLLQEPSSGYGAGDIYVRSGIYEFDAGFTGLNLQSFTRLTLDPTAFLQVPSGYSGAVFILTSNNNVEVSQSQIVGGLIREAQPRQQRWTAFSLQADANGILFNKVRDTVIYYPKTAIELNVTSSQGFINSNTFEFLRIWGAAITVDFSVIDGYQLGVEDFGILYNQFFDLHVQAYKATFQAGVRNVSGVHNTFNEVKIWDVPQLPAITVGPKADRTLIIGGTLAGEYAANPAVIADEGHATKIV